MIFHRRVIQRQLDNLRRHLQGYEVDRLVKRLNSADRDRLSAMWEAVVLSTLCELGHVEVEKEIPGGKRPDVFFSGAVNFTAEITSISDQNLEDQNPVHELTMEIANVQSDLGLPVGGLEFRIESTRRRLGSGSAVDLRIPARPDIREFVRRRIAPEIETRLKAGERPIRISIDDEEAKLSIVIDTSKAPYSSGTHPSFDVTEAIDRNPLAHALQRKAVQLRGAVGLTGIFVCDTGSASIRARGFGTTGFSPQKIVEHFLKRDGDIDFVVTLAVCEQRFGTMPRGKPKREVVVTLYAKLGLPCEDQLTTLHLDIAERIPPPRATGDNGRRQAGQPIHRWGFHGGYSMTDRSLKISVRELTELLAGRLTIEEIRTRYADMPGRNWSFPDHFERWLDEGRLPVDVRIESGGTADDDWIEFEFGDPDPATSAFR